MKRQSLHLLLSALVLCIFAVTASAQISTTALDSRVIHPFGTAFNPFGKFTGLGESGGVPGPTANGCDLYGFRAQLEPNRAVSLGIGNTPIDAVPLSPILSFESEDFPFYIQQQNAFGNGTGNNFGCGKVLASYYDDPFSNFVYQIFGSALANGGIWQVSDERLKRDVQPIEGALDKVMQLNAVSYQYRVAEYPDLNLDQGQNYGFLTQDVKEVLPGAVRSGRGLDGKKAEFDVMQYAMIVPVLAEAMKEQQDIISDQEATIESLELRLARLEKLVAGQSDLGISNDTPAANTTASNVSLAQNTPNPFRGITTINYNIPADMTNADLVVYDLNGNVLASYALENANGYVEFDASGLSSGIYVYAIINNGENIARQKMVVK